MILITTLTVVVNTYLPCVGVTLAEKLQGLTEKYPKFYFLTYWVHSFYTVLYLVWKIWRYM